MAQCEPNYWPLSTNRCQSLSRQGIIHHHLFNVVHIYSISTTINHCWYRYQVLVPIDNLTIVTILSHHHQQLIMISHYYIQLLIIFKHHQPLSTNHPCYSPLSVDSGWLSVGYSYLYLVIHRYLYQLHTAVNHYQCHQYRYLVSVGSSPPPTTPVSSRVVRRYHSMANTMFSSPTVSSAAPEAGREDGNDAWIRI